MRSGELLNIFDTFLIGQVEPGVFLGYLGIDALLELNGGEEELAVVGVVPLALVVDHLAYKEEEGEARLLLLDEVGIGIDICLTG